MENTMPLLSMATISPAVPPMDVNDGVVGEPVTDSVDTAHGAAADVRESFNTLPLALPMNTVDVDTTDDTADGSNHAHVSAPAPAGA